MAGIPHEQQSALVARAFKVEERLLHRIGYVVNPAFYQITELPGNVRTDRDNVRGALNAGPLHPLDQQRSHTRRDSLLPETSLQISDTVKCKHVRVTGLVRCLGILTSNVRMDQMGPNPAKAVHHAPPVHEVIRNVSSVSPS